MMVLYHSTSLCLVLILVLLLESTQGEDSSVVSTVNTTGTILECYDNLDKLVVDVELRQNVFEIQDYILCPNTVFNIGAPRGSLNNQGGQEALRLRKNSRFLCGPDGKSSNNCVLLGGLFQVVSWAHTFGEATKENVVVSGITFRDADASSALLVAEGDVLFRDCIFDVRHGEDVVVLSMF